VKGAFQSGLVDEDSKFAARDEDIVSLEQAHFSLGWIKIGLYNIGLSTGSDFWQGLNVFPFKKPNKLFKVAEDFSRWY